MSRSYSRKKKRTESRRSLLVARRHQDISKRKQARSKAVSEPQVSW